MMNYAILGVGGMGVTKNAPQAFHTKDGRTGLEAKMLAKNHVKTHGAWKQTESMFGTYPTTNHSSSMFAKSLKKVEMVSSSNQKLEQTTSMYPTGN